MAEVDPDVRYTAQHQWVRMLPGGVARVGITDFAQESLGDLITLTLPAVGEEFVAGEVFGEIESTKSVSEVYAPVSGVVTKVNRLLADSPEIVNDDPYQDGWLVELSVIDDSAAQGSGEEKLLAADEYRRITAG
ncbi:glycine cleavage system protein GcvH [Amycolatopsis sp. NPDC051903]|uniref:glycine cleavage system protein GcvH n=1 Tax=Amycolatopsis sp. NPDC051903 TaxID=3363936 RepID=UPI00379E92A8